MKNIEENILSNRIDLISSLKDITDLSYDQINISKFILPKYDDFINKNIDLDIGSKEIMNLEIDKNLAYTQYLPKLSLLELINGKIVKYLQEKKIHINMA